MSIYAIGDLHLSFSTNKPMNIFGNNWDNYEDKLKENWLNKINNDDIVILPGDFSWAMNLNDTLEDFKYLNELPGKKILLKGNHDYWWTTVTSINKFLKENKISNMEFLYNNAFCYEDTLIVGTRGWSFNETENSEKMLKRELIRLELSIKYGIENFKYKRIICIMHYPPITKNMIEENIKSEYIELMKKYKIDTCIYGHLHGNSHNEAVEGNNDGVNLKLVSSDYLEFNPKLIV